MTRSKPQIKPSLSHGHLDGNILGATLIGPLEKGDVVQSRIHCIPTGASIVCQAYQRPIPELLRKGASKRGLGYHLLLLTWIKAMIPIRGVLSSLLQKCYLLGMKSARCTWAVDSCLYHIHFSYLLFNTAFLLPIQTTH